MSHIRFYLVVTGVGNWDRGLHAGDESVDVVQEDHLNVGLGTDESATSEPDEKQKQKQTYFRLLHFGGF